MLGVRRSFDDALKFAKRALGQINELEEVPGASACGEEELHTGTRRTHAPPCSRQGITHNAADSTRAAACDVGAAALAQVEAIDPVPAPPETTAAIHAARRQIKILLAR